MKNYVDIVIPEEVDHSDSWGTKDTFRKIINILVENTVKEGKWFSFCTKIDEKQVDIMSVTNDEDVKLGVLIGESLYPNTNSYRSAIYKYFIRNYLCYYEIPTVKKAYGSEMYKGTFEKVMITSNLKVIADFMNITVDEAAQAYYGRISDCYLDEEDDWFPYVKLVETKEGTRKIVRPRNPLDLGKRGTRVIPLFAIDTGLKCLLENAKDDYVKVTFRKDGGQDRDIIFTMDFEKLYEVYGSCDFYHKGINTCFGGDLMDKFRDSQYGYIRVIEAGGSKYDTPCRSINFARIISIEKGASPDFTFIDIDLDSAVYEFKKNIPTNQEKLQALVAKMVKSNVMSEEESKKIGINTSLDEWVDAKSIVGTTVFSRSIALFMLANPLDFPKYTGKPIEVSVGSSDDGLSVGDVIGAGFTDNFGFAFE